MLLMYNVLCRWYQAFSRVCPDIDGYIILFYPNVELTLTGFYPNVASQKILKASCMYGGKGEIEVLYCSVD